MYSFEITFSNGVVTKQSYSGLSSLSEAMAKLAVMLQPGDTVKLL